MGRVLTDESWKEARRLVYTSWWPPEEHTPCQRIEHRTPNLERPESVLTSESDAHGTGTLSPYTTSGCCGVAGREGVTFARLSAPLSPAARNGNSGRTEIRRRSQSKSRLIQRSQSKCGGVVHSLHCRPFFHPRTTASRFHLLVLVFVSHLIKVNLQRRSLWKLSDGSSKLIGHATPAGR